MPNKINIYKNTPPTYKALAGARWRCLLAAPLLLGSAVAHGQLFQNITIGNPKALGLAHAVTADPPGIDSIHFNPAGLAKIRSNQRQLKLLAAYMELSAEIGDRHLERAQVSDDAPGVVQSYNDLYCPGEYCFPDDDAANTSSYTSKPLLNLPGSSFTEVPVLGSPFGGVAMAAPESNWTIATAVYAPAALGYERESSNDFGRFDGEKLAITKLTYFSPSVGVKLTETLSAGVSIGFSWQGLGLQTSLRHPEPTLAYIDRAFQEINEFASALPELKLTAIQPYDDIGRLTIEGDDALVPSFNVGLLWEPYEWLAFGFVYQSESVAELKGDFSMEHTDEFVALSQTFLNHPLPLNAVVGLIAGAPLNGEKVTKGTVELEYVNPAHASFGMSIRLIPSLKMNVDVKWTDYEAFENLDANFSNNIDFSTLSSLIYAVGGTGFNPDGEDNADPDRLVLQRQYESVWSWALGFSYDYNDNLVLRMGYETRPSVIPDDRVDLLVPLNEGDLYSFGAGYKLDRDSRVDFAYAYLSTSFNAPAGQSLNSNTTVPGQPIYNPYLFLDLKAKTVAHLVALSYEQKF